MSGVSSHAVTHLSAITWNIHKCIGGIDRRYRPERVIEVLKYHKPDIVMLQEVDEDAKRSNYHRQVDLIADAIGLRHRIYSPTHRLRTRGQYGNAILARWPLSDVHHLDLTIGTLKRRGAIWARCRVRTANLNRTVSVCNLHLGLVGSERTAQLERFLASHPFVGSHHRTPIILGGDFNDVTGRLGKRFLEPMNFHRAGKPASTFPAALPLRALDAIFTRGDIKTHSCHPSRLELTRVASDHLPLVAHFTLLAAPHVPHPK